MSSKEKRKLAAIMFADVVGYSRMMASNEERTLELLKDFENICSPIISKHDGEIIKKVGDELFCEFSSAKQAVDCALEIQEAIQPYNDSRPKDYKLQVRIGIHVGDIVLRDGDVFGDGVNVASRIQPFANPGGICVSNAVRDAISSHPSYNIKSEGQQELKNIIEKHTLYKVETGFETIEPSGSKEHTALKKSRYKKVSLFILFLLCSVLGYFSYIKIYSEDTSELFQNFYLHFTSSDNYIDHYYIDYGFGSYHFYDKEGFQVESISDSLLGEIRSKVFAKISSSFSNHDLSIDASFYENEREVLDEFLFIKINKANEEELKALKINTDKFSEIITKRINYYKDKGLPDVLARFFIYKVQDIDKNEEYLIMDNGTTYGKQLWTANGNNSWSVDQSTYDINNKGIDKLVEKIYEKTYHRVNTGAYGDSRVGKVIAILDNDMVKIKMKRPGALKKKMRISSHRTYHWVKGGAEDRIEDLNQLIEHMNTIDLETTWKHFQPTEPFDEAKAIMMRTESIIQINFEIQQIKDNLENNKYGEHTTSDMDDLSYFMEVVETIDSVAIARITGSNVPIYRIRIGDFVLID
jgi:class 3 adenylate cyclase